jgi:ketosteroid isomerase-like protein
MPDDIAREIARLEDARYAAMIKGDVEALGALLADDLVYAHSFGDRDSKESYVAKVKSGNITYSEISHPIERIIARGDMAIVAGRMIATAMVGGEVRRLNNSCLAVWARREGRWELVAYQPTPLPPAK